MLHSTPPTITLIHCALLCYVCNWLQSTSLPFLTSHTHSLTHQLIQSPLTHILPHLLTLIHSYPPLILIPTHPPITFSHPTLCPSPIHPPIPQFKYFLPDPVANDVKYQASAQPFLVFGILDTALAVGHHGPL
jgi:hypothetical protein